MEELRGGLNGRAPHARLEKAVAVAAGHGGLLLATSRGRLVRLAKTTSERLAPREALLDREAHEAESWERGGGGT